MNHYYYTCPRGFSNEFSVISVDTESKRECALLAEMQEAYAHSNNIDWDFHRITAKRAREIVATERAEARAYAKAGLNLSENPVGATEIITITEYFAY